MLRHPCAILLALFVFPSTIWAQPEATKVTEVAPGVYFRKAQTAPVFTGCNQGWVIFRDYVLIIDANFPGQAEEVLAAIRKTTDKPIRFVFDTHYHGDHADGNMQYVKLGATIVAQERSQPLFMTKGIAGFENAKKDRAQEYAELSYEVPSMYFSHKLVFDDGQQRVELMFFGHAHTAGDAAAWLPKHGILFTGDACVNGPFNYTGDSSTESWVAALAGMEELGIKKLCPGHGEMGGPEVVANQKRYFAELRGQVGKLIAAGKGLDEIKKSIEIPFYKEWTGVEAQSRTENIEHVFSELSAPKKPLKQTTYFRQWNSLPGQDGYRGIGAWESLGEADTDVCLDKLADLYLVSDSQGRKELRDNFANSRELLDTMWLYVRRTAARLMSDGNVQHLQRGLAIAAIEGGRVDYRDTTVSLVLLRHAAEKRGLEVATPLREIQELVPPENRPMFENVRTHSAADVTATVVAFGPQNWSGS